MPIRRDLLLRSALLRRPDMPPPSPPRAVPQAAKAPPPAPARRAAGSAPRRQGQAKPVGLPR